MDDENVETAKLAADALGCGGNRGHIRHVEMERMGIRPNIFGSCLAAREIARPDQHSEAVRHEILCDLKTDSLIIRDDASAYFTAHGITWHQHANHALSSQVTCLNFLMPLATRPKLLASVIGNALGISSPTMLEVESGPDGRPWFVGFEWIGRADYLNEVGNSGIRTRGANATSADAVVRFEHEGRIETVLIEWKYTESYGAPIPPKGNQVRLGRYRDLVFAPFGPVREDYGLAIGDFFWEPFYQLVRQQMLAFQMQAAHEDGAERVRVLHIAPSENRALHTVTAPALLWQ